MKFILLWFCEKISHAMFRMETEVTNDLKAFVFLLQCKRGGVEASKGKAGEGRNGHTCTHKGNSLIFKRKGNIPYPSFFFFFLPYHTPQILMTSVLLPFDVLLEEWQCRPWSDTAFCGVWSGSLLLTQFSWYVRIPRINTVFFFYSRYGLSSLKKERKTFNLQVLMKICLSTGIWFSISERVMVQNDK